VIFTLLGFALGRTALRALMFTQRFDVRLGVVAVVLIVILGFMVRRRRANARAVAMPVDAMITTDETRVAVGG
jgi:hypothetical protein